MAESWVAHGAFSQVAALATNVLYFHSMLSNAFLQFPRRLSAVSVFLEFFLMCECLRGQTRPPAALIFIYVALLEGGPGEAPMTLSSLRRTIDAKALWPIGADWYVHAGKSL